MSRPTFTGRWPTMEPRCRVHHRGATKEDECCEECKEKLENLRRWLHDPVFRRETDERFELGIG